METVIGKIFFQHWQQKLVALLTAIVLWFFVSHSIMETKIVPSVPIRIVNIPPDYTILGMLPSGMLQKRITLTITGTKDVVESLEPGDLEVVIDASIIDHRDWVLRISKTNLLSLDPSIDLKQQISQVSHSEYVIKLRRLVTEQIPVTIKPPQGEAPHGYEFLDIWPQTLVQTFSGAEEEIELIQQNGLEIEFDLNRISKHDLDTASLESPSKDEVSFLIPPSWKKIHIPCQIQSIEELNDESAEDMEIDFLRQQVFAIGEKLPIRIFYPLEYQETINPKTYPLAINDDVSSKLGIFVFIPDLYVHDVTEIFLQTIRSHMEIVVTAAPKSKRDMLEWCVEVIDPYRLEDNYVEALFKLHPKKKEAPLATTSQREAIYRKRFREYMEKLVLYISPELPLNIEAFLDDGKITVRTLSP